MQGTLFNPGERVQRRKVRVRKQRQCVGTQLEFNTDARLNNQLRTIGTLPDYLLEPISAQSERTASRLILKLCRSIRRLWDGNTIEEEPFVSGRQFRVTVVVNCESRVLRLQGRNINEAMQSKDWTLYEYEPGCKYGSWIHALALAHVEELGDKWERGVK